jgi:hypothetical protein
MHVAGSGAPFGTGRRAKAPGEQTRPSANKVIEGRGATEKMACRTTPAI